MGVVESSNPVPYTLYLSVFEPHEGSRGVVSFIIGHYYLLSKIFGTFRTIPYLCN
jgi:hypothetical protein